MPSKIYNASIKIARIFRWTVPLLCLFALSVGVGEYVYNSLSQIKNNWCYLSPYPWGKNFALSIIDDTDFSTVQAIKPVYEVLQQLGFRTTKTVWVFDAIHTNTNRKEQERNVHLKNCGSSLEDPQYLDFILSLRRRGFEIILHGVSAGNDHRKEIILGYERFKKIFGNYPKIDTLHAQNIENIYAGYNKLDNPLLRIVDRLVCRDEYQGHIKGSNYFWGDLCQDRVKYVRLPFHTIKKINLLKVNPSMPFHDPRRPYVNYWFPNSDGSDFKDFMRLTSERNIKKLWEERGTTIIYTHFANGFCQRSGKDFVVKRAFQDRMRRLAKMDGWFVPAFVILDRLLAMKNVMLLKTKKMVCIVNANSTDIDGLTIIMPSGEALFDANGVKHKPNDEGEIVLPVLRANSVFTFFKEAPRMVKPTLKEYEIGLLEHTKIEVENYYGQFLEYLGY